MQTKREILSTGPLRGVRSRPVRRLSPNLWYFAAPTLSLNVVIVAVPAVLTVLLAFFSWDGIGTPVFVGGRNFVTLLADPIFWQSLGNNLKWMLLFLTVPVLTGLLLASQLYVVRRGKTFFQLAFFLPHVIASVVIARVWQGMIYSPSTGLVSVLNQLSPALDLQSPLAQTSTSLYGVALTDMWQWWGFLGVVFFSALRQVDVQQVEAGLVEGASTAQIFRHILIPSIRPTLVLMLVMTVIWSFVAFEYVYVLTAGGPAFSSELLSTLAYRQAFSDFNVGQAAATSVIIGCLGLIATTVYIRLQNRDGDL